MTAKSARNLGLRILAYVAVSYGFKWGFAFLLNRARTKQGRVPVTCRLDRLVTTAQR